MSFIRLKALWGKRRINTWYKHFLRFPQRLLKDFPAAASKLALCDEGFNATCTGLTL